MANLLEDIQCSGSDTRPPMLDRTDFASWQQRIRLYYWGKENRVNILKSIDEGPFQMGTVREPLAKGTERAPHLGPEQYRHKGETIHDYNVWFSKLINDMRNIKMNMSRMQLNSKFVNNMLPEWGRFVTTVKLNRGLRDSNYDQLYAYLKQYEAHANENKMMLDQFTQHTVDPLALMSNVSHQQHYLHSSSTPPSTYDLALNVDNVFQADDCDAFDSNVDEAPTAQTMFMANLSSVDPVYDEAGPSYDLDILFEVHNHDHSQDDLCEPHDKHEMHDNVQLNHIIDSHANYTSNSNMIMHDQYVKDNVVPGVQSNVSSVLNDAYIMIYNDMYEPHAQSVPKTSRNTVVDNSLTAKLTTYKEQVKLYERRARFKLTE
uniref:Retrovirus-related Pol polyprotein from transposon TNT 1-94 n=1 Tax=Tanacetum cinerariifolium TaxID=118510 RepID=A0A6L2LQT2_TANCI|nr:retrovirus-related Pol polyprotein from transposon TNT 1-94 [Tanacetum cinerariifolium]